MSSVRTTTESSSAASRAPRIALRLALRAGALFLLLCAVLYLTSGTLHYWEAYVYLIALFAPLLFVSGVFLMSEPAVLEYRLHPHETDPAQRSLVRWFRPLFLLTFLIPGLDTRFRWSDAQVETVPHWLAILADCIVTVSILFAGWVLSINHRAGRPAAPSGPQLITGGPYSIIRHPLYAASIVLWMATPIALGSWVALPAFLAVTPFYVLRLRRQEKLLHRQLPGYAAYCKRTPFRLIPWIW